MPALTSSHYRVSTVIYEFTNCGKHFLSVHCLNLSQAVHSVRKDVRDKGLSTMLGCEEPVQRTQIPLLRITVMYLIVAVVRSNAEISYDKGTFVLTDFVGVQSSG